MKQVVLRHPLEAKPTAADFTLIETPRPACPDGGVVIELSHVSLDPYVGARLRGRHMGEPAPEPGSGVIPGAGVGRVVESRHGSIAEGDWVATMEGGWRDYAAAPGDQVRAVDLSLAPPSAHVGVLGMPGLTAWAGMTTLAKTGEGDVVLVDAAAGPVGGTAGQIARLRGAAKVIGIAGGPEKCGLVVDGYGFDACVDYKQSGWEDQLAAAVGEGISVHFENVSVALLTTAMGHLKLYGRVVLCGLAEHYHADAPAPGLPAGLVVGKRAALYGLVVYDYYDRWEAFLAEVGPWVADGRVRTAEDVANGLENAPALMERLVNGRHVGKAVVAVRDAAS